MVLKQTLSGQVDQKQQHNKKYCGFLSLSYANLKLLRLTWLLRKPNSLTKNFINQQIQKTLLDLTYCLIEFVNGVSPTLDNHLPKLSLLEGYVERANIDTNILSKNDFLFSREAQQINHNLPSQNEEILQIWTLFNKCSNLYIPKEFINIQFNEKKIAKLRIEKFLKLSLINKQRSANIIAKESCLKPKRVNQKINQILSQSVAKKSLIQTPVKAASNIKNIDLYRKDTFEEEIQFICGLQMSLMTLPISLISWNVSSIKSEMLRFVKEKGLRIFCYKNAETAIFLQLLAIKYINVTIRNPKDQVQFQLESLLCLN